MAFRKGARARAESAIIIETRGLERCPPLPPARELHIVIAERESRTLRHTHTHTYVSAISAAVWCFFHW